jgi:AcrR family transcriptional regulator
MSPRPRQASDEDILKATFRAIARSGPSRLTLADVASEAGVSAAALVQRFGSKRALLLAAAADAARGADFLFPALRARHRSPVQALLGLADCMTMLGGTPGEVAHNLAFLHLDLTDPEFHRHALEGARRTRAALRALVREAVACGELVRCDAGRLAAALQSTLDGSLRNWTVQRDGELADWLRRDLRTVLEPYRVPRRGRARPAAAPRRRRAAP